MMFKIVLGAKILNVVSAKEGDDYSKVHEGCGFGQKLFLTWVF